MPTAEPGLGWGSGKTLQTARETESWASIRRRIFKTEMKGLTDDESARTAVDVAKPEPAASTTPVVPVAPVSPQAPVVVPPSLGADTSAAVPTAEQAEPAAEAPREAPQQQTQS
jgi:hypothetical protein